MSNDSYLVISVLLDNHVVDNLFITHREAEADDNHWVTQWKEVQNNVLHLWSSDRPWALDLLSSTAFNVVEGNKGLGLQPSVENDEGQEVLLSDTLWLTEGVAASREKMADKAPTPRIGRERLEAAETIRGLLGIEADEFSDEILPRLKIRVREAGSPAPRSTRLKQRPAA